VGGGNEPDMIPQSLIVLVLILLACAAAVTLWFDARQQRMNRQLETALPAAQAANLLSIRRSETKSRWHLLHRLVNYQAGIPHTLHPALVLLSATATAAAVIYANRLAGLSPFYVFLAAFAVALFTARGLFGWQQRRFVNQLFRQLPDVLQLVTSTVKSGLPVNEAFHAIAREMSQPTAGQFAVVCNELSLGKTPDEAIEAVYRRTLVPEYAMFSVTLAVQLKAGGSLAETLQTLAETVTQRVALAARAKALAGEVIFSSRALVCAPFIVGGLLYLINPQSIDLLFRDATGNRLLIYALGSILLGHFVIRWMIRRETTL